MYCRYSYSICFKKAFWFDLYRLEYEITSKIKNLNNVIIDMKIHCFSMNDATQFEPMSLSNKHIQGVIVVIYVFLVSKKNTNPCSTNDYSSSKSQNVG